MLKINANTIEEFISAYPADVQDKLRKLRDTIRKAAPQATEAIKYGIPTFVLSGNLVHFAGYDHHIGFYPGASGIVEFKKELASYETSKGTVKFPLDKPLPLALILQIVKFRVAQNLAKKSKTSELRKPSSKAPTKKLSAKARTTATALPGKKTTRKKSSK